MNNILVAMGIISTLSLAFGAVLGCVSCCFVVKNNTIAEKIDEFLPQNQCGQCGYPGCRPYAEAIDIQKEKINRCIPGGETVMLKIATLLNIDPQPLYKNTKKKSIRMVAFIDEPNCIGCMKCIHICPVDAVVGTARIMHTVIADLCTGCGLCVIPCPTQCIKLRSSKIGITYDNQNWALQTVPINIISTE